MAHMNMSTEVLTFGLPAPEIFPKPPPGSRPLLGLVRKHPHFWGRERTVGPHQAEGAVADAHVVVARHPVPSRASSRKPLAKE